MLCKKAINSDYELMKLNYFKIGAVKVWGLYGSDAGYGLLPVATMSSARRIVFAGTLTRKADPKLEFVPGVADERPPTPAARGQ